jgi:5-methylcytosine-specific restriction enzyme subunit McrC
MSVYELTEEVVSDYEKNKFEEQAAIKIYNDFSNYIDITFPTAVNNLYSLKPMGYIGHIPIFDNIIIKIQPKVPVKNIFLMLEYAYGLKSFKFLEGTVQLNNISDLYESLASVLAKMVLDRNRKGLYRDYIKKRNSCRI